MTKRVAVETREYELSHGRRPRGRGYWAFTFETRTYKDVSEVWWTPGGMTYSEAVKLAKAEAVRRGQSWISVQS